MHTTTRPKLGQHFLASERYCRRIVDSLSIGANDLVIEIGAGRGALTALLRARAQKVVAVELDQNLAKSLMVRFRDDPRIEIIVADILSTNLADICKNHGQVNAVVVGNLPYYITSPIIERLRKFSRSVRAMGLLVQKEVAERIVAEPGGRDYGYLSVSTQLFTRPRILLSVPPGAFSPPPKVDSALVDFAVRPRFPEMSAAEEEEFLHFVKRGFAHKRKTLLNNLSSVASRGRVEECLAHLRLTPTARAEQLTMEQFRGLFEEGLGRLADGPRQM